jgi:hypothetical protein
LNQANKWSRQPWHKLQLFVRVIIINSCIKYNLKLLFQVAQNRDSSWLKSEPMTGLVTTLNGQSLTDPWLRKRKLDCLEKTHGVRTSQILNTLLTYKTGVKLQSNTDYISSARNALLLQKWKARTLLTSH